jgi:hypothetical protein
VHLSTARTSTMEFSSRWRPNFKETVGQNVIHGHFSIWTIPNRTYQKLNLVIMEELHLKRIAYLSVSPDIGPSDFFFFAWLKIELVS